MANVTFQTHEVSKELKIEKKTKRGRTAYLLAGHLFAVDVDPAGGVFEDGPVERHQQVVPLVLLQQVRAPHPQTGVPATLRLPVVRAWPDGVENVM